MTEISRQKIFEAAIASFLNEKREKEALKKTGATPEKYNKPEWLEKTAKILQKTSVQIGTHLPKATHSDVKGGMIYAKNLPSREEIGTHLLKEANIIPDASGNGAENAAVLEGWAFLHLSVSVEGKTLPLKDWLKAEDPDALNALSEISGKGKNLASSLLSFIERESLREGEAVSDGNAKQLYWLKKDGSPSCNADFVLVQPLYPSSLAHVVYEHLQNARFGKDDDEKARLKEGRDARKASKYWEGVLQEFPNMAKRNLGGTKPQNVSQLNSLRRGGMLFFSAAPPAWESKGRLPPLKGKKPIMNWIMSRGDARENLKRLIQFLRKNPRRIMQTRDRRDDLQDKILEDILAQTAALRQILPRGWSANPDHQNIPLCERLWLDTGRIEDKVAFNSEADKDFRDLYDQGDWADEISNEMALYINDSLKKANIFVDDVDHDYWARNPNLILDVAWPEPMFRKSPSQRRADRKNREETA